jgi:hypothetical protein
LSDLAHALLDGDDVGGVAGFVSALFKHSFEVSELSFKGCTIHVFFLSRHRAALGRELLTPAPTPQLSTDAAAETGLILVGIDG